DRFHLSHSFGAARLRSTLQQGCRSKRCLNGLARGNEDEAQVVGYEEIRRKLPIFRDLRVTTDQSVEVMSDAFVFDIAKNARGLSQFVIGRAFSDALWLVDYDNALWSEASYCRF